MLHINNLDDLERATALRSIRPIKSRPDLTEIRAENPDLYRKKVSEILEKIRGKHE